MRDPSAAIAAGTMGGAVFDVLEEFEHEDAEFRAASKVSCNRDSILSNLISERVKYVCLIG